MKQRNIPTNSGESKRQNQRLEDKKRERGMVKSRKGAALLQYSVLLVIITLALAAMNTYLRRGVQARIKDLTDLCIGRKHIGLLDETEYTKEITSSSGLVKEENERGTTSSTVVNSTETIDKTVWSEYTGDSYLTQSTGNQKAIKPVPYVNGGN